MPKKRKAHKSNKKPQPVINPGNLIIKLLQGAPTTNKLTKWVDLHNFYKQFISAFLLYSSLSAEQYLKRTPITATTTALYFKLISKNVRRLHYAPISNIISHPAWKWVRG